MASTTDGCCLNDPNFAVICSFINNFGDKLILPEISFEDLQESLEDTKAASDLLVDLHVHLLRRIGKKVTTEKWQRSVVKFCHYFDNADAWEIEQNGYEKAKVSTKLKVLKNLLETQFDLNLKFKDKIGEVNPTVLRCQPLGRDINGGSYWYLIDKELNLRIYREEHPTLKEDEVWKVICRDRDDLASLVATLDAEINPNAEEKVQDPKIEEESKVEGNENEEGIVKQEGIVKKEEIVKQEDKTDSSTILQQHDLGHQSDNKPIETDKIAGVESSSVKDTEIKKNSGCSSAKSTDEPESKALVKSVIEDGCVKVEPKEGILKPSEPLREGKDGEYFKKKEERVIAATSENKEDKSLENEERNEFNKDKGSTDSMSESKAEKRKLSFSEPTEIGSKSRKECSDRTQSGSPKTVDNNCKSEKLSETVSKETAAANLRRESVIKIGKRVDKVIPLEESAKQDPSENKEVLPEKIKNDDIVVISDTDKDIEAIVKNEEVKKRMNELNKSPDCYKLDEKLNEEMNKNLQFIDDENCDDKIVLMKEYTKDREQMDICKERVSSAFRGKPPAVGSEDKVPNLHEVKIMSVAKTSDSDKIQAEDHKSEAKSSIKEQKLNKLQSVGDCSEKILPQKCNIEKPETGHDPVHSGNKESRENLKVLNSCKKGKEFQNNDSNLQKASEDTQKELNIGKKLEHKVHNCEKESSNDDKQLNVENLQSANKHLKLGHKPVSCNKDSAPEHKSQSSDKKLDSQNKSLSSEKESDTRSKSHSSDEKSLDIERKPCKSKEEPVSGKRSNDTKEELTSASKPQAKEKGSVTGNISSCSEEQPDAANKPGDRKGGVVAESIPPGSKGKAVDGSRPPGSERKNADESRSPICEGKSADTNEAVAKSKPSGGEEKVGAGSKEEMVASSKPGSSVEKTSSGSKPGSKKEEAVERGPCGSEEKSSAQNKSGDKEEAVAEVGPGKNKEKLGAKSKPCDKKGAVSESGPCSRDKKLDAKSCDSKEEVIAKSSRPSDSEDKSGGDSKSCGSKEKDIAKGRPSDSKEKSGGDSKSCGIKEEITKGRPSESEEKSGGDSKSCGIKEEITKGRPSESEEKSGGDSKSCGSKKEKEITKSRSESEEKSKSDKSKSSAKSSGSSVEKSGSRSKSCIDEEEEVVSKSKSFGSEKEKKESIAKSRPHDNDDELSAGNRSPNGEEEPGGKSRPLGTKVEPGGKSSSLGNRVELGDKSDVEQSAENKPHNKEGEEEEAGSRDKPLDVENKPLKTDKIPTDCHVNKQLDESKIELSQSKESSKSVNTPDEKNAKNTDGQHHSVDLHKLKISLNKIEATVNEEMSAGNEEKKLTCKIVIKRKSRKKGRVSAKDADGADEVDDDDEADDDDSGKMAKNREDNVEYKCELSSVPVDDKAEESGKKDCIQRVRKRKACDKMPVTSKNDRKTTEDLGNEECMEQIENNDKNTNPNLKPELDSKEGTSDTEENNVRTSRRLRARRTNKPSGLETEQTKTAESAKEVKATEGNSVPSENPENEAQVTRKTRARRRTQAELICMDLIIPEEEKRTRGRKRQSTSAEVLSVEETLEEIEPKKVKGSKNFRKTNMSRLKDVEEQFSSQSDSDDMPLSKMSKSTTRGRARGRGRSKNSRQPLTVIEESVTPTTRKSSRASKKKEVDANDFDTSNVKSHHATGKSNRGGSSAAGKGSRSRQRKKRSSSVESDKWVSDKTEGEEEEEEDDEEEEDLFVGELLRRSSRVRSLGTKNKLLCISASSDEKSETNEDTSDEEFQLPKGRNARRAAARSAGIKEETEKIDENDNEPCCHCQKFDRPETILLCDKCDAGYHTLCLTPPLHIIPEGDWFCPPCEHKLLLEKLMTNLHELDIQLKKRERLMKRKERLAFVGISLDNILSEKKENMEPNVDCPNPSLSTTRTCRVRRSINYKFTEFDELIDSAIQDDLSTVHDPEAEGAIEERDDSSQNGKDMSNITNSVDDPVSRGKDMDTIMTVYSDGNDLRPQGIQAKKEAGRRRGKDISNLVGRGSDSDEQYPAPRKRRPKRKLTTLDSDSYASDSDEYKASEDSDASVDMDASEYSEEDEDDDDDDEDYGTRRRSARTSTRQNYRASRKSGRAATRRSRRQRFDGFVVDDDYDSDESANYRRSTRASVKRKVNYREKASDEEEEAEMTPTEDEESSTEPSGLGSDDSVKPNKKLKLKLTKKKTKRVIRESPSDDDDDKSSKSSGSVADEKNKKKLTRKRRLAVSDSGSSSSSQSESGVRRSCRASTQKMNFKKLLDSDTEEECIKIERPYTVTKPKKKAILSDSDSIASDDKSSIKSFTLDKNDNDSKFSHSSTGAANDDADTIAIVAPPLPPTITADTTPSTSTTTTTTNNNNSHEAHLKEDQQNEEKSVDSSFSQMNGHDNEKKDTKDTHLEKTENRTIDTELHQEDNCNNDNTNDDTSNLGTSTSRSGPQVANILTDSNSSVVVYE